MREKKEGRLLFLLLEFPLIFNKQKYLFFGFFIIYSLFINSCKNLLDPGQPGKKYSLLCNLTLNNKEQKLYLYNIVSLNENAYPLFLLQDYDKYFAENAVININLEGQTLNNFLLKRDTNNVRYYGCDNLKLKPGEKYNLEVRIGNQLINGSTTIPEDFQIISPTENQNIYFSNYEFTIDIKWKGNKTIYGYILFITYPFYLTGTNSYHTSYFNKVVFDSSYEFKDTYLPSDKVTINLLGFDKNYYEHIFKGKESSGIKGAYGYFGSSILKTVKVIVK